MARTVRAVAGLIDVADFAAAGHRFDLGSRRGGRRGEGDGVIAVVRYRRRRRGHDFADTRHRLGAVREFALPAVVDTNHDVDGVVFHADTITISQDQRIGAHTAFIRNHVGVKGDAGRGCRIVLNRRVAATVKPSYVIVHRSTRNSSGNGLRAAFQRGTKDTRIHNFQCGAIPNRHLYRVCDTSVRGGVGIDRIGYFSSGVHLRDRTAVIGPGEGHIAVG